MPMARSIRALIVDDQLTIRQLVRHGLEHLGLREIQDASDGAVGLQSMLSTPSNLVISDYNMPNLDGLGLLRAIREHAPIRSTAFIMLTGRAENDLVQRAVRLGVNNYLVKPFTVAMLKEKIEAVFGPLT